MTVTPDLKAQCEVVGVRVRLGWRGKLILQVRNRMELMPLFEAPKDAGFSTWRDANSNDPEELAQAIRLLSLNTKRQTIKDTGMGLFDYVNFEMDCPKCGKHTRGFQTKDGDVCMNLVELENVANVYCPCECGYWIELKRALPPAEPQQRKPPATFEDARKLGFHLVVRDDLSPDNQVEK